MSSHPLMEIVAAQKRGIPRGITSVCSAHEIVIEAAMEYARDHGDWLLIEATSNQVNQYGGYTGMRPRDFRAFVSAIAAKVGFPLERLILGGDHLGPNPWKGEPAAAAMAKAEALVYEYAAAGYSKIHLDASMHLADDPKDRSRRLDGRIVAQRTAALCRAAEEGFRAWRQQVPDAPEPVYVIGSEVPVPGGAEAGDADLKVTEPADFNETIALAAEAFRAAGLAEAFERVIAVVVQPGVEFGDGTVHPYDRARAAALVAALRQVPGVVFEGHSTDYQTPEALKALVEDGVAILKVGPALTFAVREALFALSFLEEELCAGRPEWEPSRLRDVLEEAMLAEPADWVKYYQGDERALRLARRYSLSDRVRYYWGKPRVREAVARLYANLRSEPLPLPLISQFLPKEYPLVRAGRLAPEPHALVKAHVKAVLAEYREAVTP